MSPIPEVIMAEILDGVTADEDGKTYDSHALKPIRMLCAELTALRKVAEALQVYVADWDSQVSDPRAACYQCEDPEHIKQFRAALAAAGVGGGE